MTRLPLLCALAVTACTTTRSIDIEADEVDGKADGMPSHLHLVDDHRVDVAEPSDLAFWDGALYTVSDRHSKIYEIDDDGDVRNTIDVDGRDLEALAVDEDGHFYIADESRAKIWRVDRHGERKESFDVDLSDSNSGIEGLTFDDDGNMLVAQEKDPSRVVTLDTGNGDELDRTKLNFLDDLSAITWNFDDDHPYALSDEDHSLYRLDHDFDKITRWKLPIDKPEGVAFDGSRVYIVSDSEERLYIFELE